MLNFGKVPYLGTSSYVLFIGKRDLLEKGLPLGDLRPAKFSKIPQNPLSAVMPVAP